MAAGLLDIKRRIKSVKSTKKITKAMGLVATAKLRKTKNLLVVNDEYFNSLDRIRDKIFSAIEVGCESPFVNKNSSEKKLIVLFASNSGLCGGFNANVTTYLNNIYSDNKDNVSVFLIGRRGEAYLKKFGFTIYDKFFDFKENLDLKDARTISSKILEAYLNNEFGHISLISTVFKSSIDQEVNEFIILPFTKENTNNLADNDESIINEENEREIFESEISDEELVSVFLYRYLEGKLINAMVHSRACEENFRMQAMDGATKNADDILEKLQSKYNRIRQGAITQEISEIVGGAEAQK